LSEYFEGQIGGSQFVTLIQSEMPAHTHAINANAVTGGLPDPSNGLWSPLAGRTPPNLYQSGPANTNMNFQALGIAGGSLPHNNMSPYLVVNFCIAMQGVFPPRQ
jgi:microcystin-dependent protein